MNDTQQTLESGSTPLDTMVCFALYTAARATNRRYTTILAPWGLTYPQYIVLVLLWSRRSLSVTSLSVTEVAENLMLDSGTTSPLIRRLETRGLVKRERSSSDERSVMVSLTGAGLALREELAQVPACIAEATQLDAADAKTALSILHDVTRNLSSAAAPGENTDERHD